VFNGLDEAAKLDFDQGDAAERYPRVPSITRSFVKRERTLVLPQGIRILSAVIEHCRDISDGIMLTIRVV
jgi:hypothetical protein